MELGRESQEIGGSVREDISPAKNSNAELFLEQPSNYSSTLSEKAHHP